MTNHTYADQDLVYVYPQKKRVIGLVEWSKDGIPLKKLIEEDTPEEVAEALVLESTKKPDVRPKKIFKNSKRYYPWCTYKTAKKVYSIEGKFIEELHYESFETVLNKALKQPYWEVS